MGFEGVEPPEEELRLTRLFVWGFSRGDGKNEELAVRGEGQAVPPGEEEVPLRQTDLEACWNGSGSLAFADEQGCKGGGCGQREGCLLYTSDAADE